MTVHCAPGFAVAGSHPLSTSDTASLPFLHWLPSCFRYNSAMKRILLMVILLSVPLCAQTPEAKSTPAAQQSITVSKLPPVTIAKDGIDWATVANYLLVVVGIGGIAVAIWTLCYIRKQAIEMRRQRILMLRTLRAIQKQARHMGDQTTILGNSVIAAQKSADAADISAKAAMGVAVPTLRIEGFALQGDWHNPDNLRFPRVSILLRNHGTTPAFLQGLSLAFVCGDLPEKPEYKGCPVPSDNVVPPGKTISLDGGHFLPSLSQEDVQSVLDERHGFAVCGRVSYEDIFESPMRHLVFSKIVMNLLENGSIDWWGREYNEYEGQNPN